MIGKRGRPYILDTMVGGEEHFVACRSRKMVHAPPVWPTPDIVPLLALFDDFERRMGYQDEPRQERWTVRHHDQTVYFSRTYHRKARQIYATFAFSPMWHHPSARTVEVRIKVRDSFNKRRVNVEHNASYYVYYDGTGEAEFCRAIGSKTDVATLPPRLRLAWESWSVLRALERT